MRSTVLKIGLMSFLLAGAATAQAKTTTINDVTLDVPDGFKVSNSQHGLLAKTPDGEVDVWVETFKDADTPAMMREHEDYWKKQKVEFNGDGEHADTMSGDVHVSKTDYIKATWKGDPTVLRYTAIGPLGPDRKVVLITYWASPGGDKEFGAAIDGMIGTMNVKIDP